MVGKMLWKQKSKTFLITEYVQVPRTCWGRLLITLLLTLCLCVSIAKSETNYVWQSSPSPTSPYTNWSTAAHVIQDAVDAAIAGDLVLVTNGFYTTGGGLTPGFSLSNRVTITKSITLKSVNGPTNTLIVGQGSMGSNAVRCAYLTNSAEIIGFTLSNGFTHSFGDWNYEQGGGGLLNCGSIISNSLIIDNYANRGSGICCISGFVYNCSIKNNNYGGIFCDAGSTIKNCVIFGNKNIGVFFYKGGIVSNCIIEANVSDFGGGLHYHNGGLAVNCSLINNNSTNNGGGVYIYAGGTINMCDINQNTAKEYGGGIYCYANGFINNCKISGNSVSKYGGGVYLNSGGIVSNCTISENIAGDIMNTAGHGGGIVLQNGGIVNNSIIKNNTAFGKVDWSEGGEGGGVFCWSGGQVNNCLITGNEASGRPSEGGGVLCYLGGTINNCTIFNNYGREGGGGVAGGTIRNSIVYSNFYHRGVNNHGGASFEYSCTTPLPIGEGNISDNPVFEFAATGNYRLAFGSPCINSGTNAYVVGDWDLAGNDRIVGGRVDMGCYESPIPEPFLFTVYYLLFIIYIFKFQP